MLNFKKERINFKKVLGKGAFGIVRPYQKNENDEKWAVKIIKAYTFEDLQVCFKEIVLGFSCDNPYILPVRGYLIEQDKQMEDWNVYMKLPRMQNGSLRDVLNDYKKDHSPIPEVKIAQYFYEIICGLRYLHGKNIAHRDIKPENILFDEDKTVKIADFGIGDINDGNNTTYALAEKAGAMCYTAPENRDMNANLFKKDLFATDLWSLGMTMFELCTQYSQVELKQLVLSCSGEKLEDMLKEKLQEREKRGEYSKILINMICSLLRLKPTERRSLRDVCEELVSHYGTQLKMNHHNKGAQTDLNFENSQPDQDLKARQQELEKKIEERNAYIEAMRKHYKSIITDLETQIKKMQENEFRMPNEEWKKNIDNIKVEKLEERPLNPEETSKQIQLFMKEIERDWIVGTKEGGNGIVVSPRRPDAVTDESVKKIAIQIGTNLKTLHLLHLNFGSCHQITDESMKEIAVQIGTNLITLESLHLNFRSCDKITDKSMKEIAIQIGSSLKKLQSLHLDVRNLYKISDESMKEIGVQIGTNLKTLQSLHLNFSLCKQISDDRVKEIAVQICTNLKTLQSLHLNFSACHQITDESMKEIAVQIGTNLMTLESLHLDFRSCNKITDKSAKELTMQICSNLKILQGLKLVFSSTSVSSEVKDDMRSQCKHIESVFID